MQALDCVRRVDHFLYLRHECDERDCLFPVPPPGIDDRMVFAAKITDRIEFAGTDGGARHWVCLISLIETAKHNSVDPLAYLTAVLEALAASYSINRIAELLPWRWAREAPTLDQR